MLPRILVPVVLALWVAVPSSAIAAPDPERSPDAPAFTNAASPFVGTDAKKMLDAIVKIGARSPRSTSRS